MPDDRHVPWRRLVDRHDGRLSPLRAADAEAHLSGGCAVCTDEARTVERLVTAIAGGPPDAAPRRAEEAAIRLFRDTYLAFARDAECMLGVLILDRSGELPAAATRAGAGEVRHLLWRVGDFEIDASIVARSGCSDVLAQIVPGGDDPDVRVAGAVSARSARGVHARARIEPDGRFTFRGLAPGVYTFEGRVDALRFVLPPIHVE